MSERPVRALGEIALRVNDLEGMARVCGPTVGLEPMRRFPNAAFFRIAEGFEGHTQILALFDRSQRDENAPEATRTSLDHFAFAISLDDYFREKARLEGLGLEVTTAAHG